ncbi:glycosyltransferase [Modestobacter sp. NPDC049651]|uniref:glycosyltransferase n=1 Tax=unclassified Modestobacter TaxID=2643866 RepID=UPI0033E18BA1
MTPSGPTVLQFSTLVPPARYGGAERVVDWMSRDLRRAQVAVHNAGLAPRGRARPAEGTHGIRNLYWPFDGDHGGTVRRAAWQAVDTWGLAARRVVDRLIDRVQPSVVVTHNLRGWGYAPWVGTAASGVPLVHVVHDYSLICQASSLWRGRPCDRVCLPCRPRRAATRSRWPGGEVVGVSRAVLDQHARHGVDFGRPGRVAHPTAAAVPVSPVRAGSPPDRPPAVLGYLGQLSAPKGLGLLLRAARTTSQRLLVAGAGERSEVAALHREAGPRVEWLGRTDPQALFAAIDVLVVPSVWPEPFGLVVVEAAAAGVPVLLADQPGLVEAARAGGARVLVVPAGDQSALAGALHRPLSAYAPAPPPAEEADVVGLVSRIARGVADLPGGEPGPFRDRPTGGTR